MKEKNIKQEEVTITIPMKPNMELAIMELSASMGRLANLQKDQIDEVKMALIEACLNAFEHSKSRDQKVHIKFMVKDNELEITVKDYGIGFNPEDVEVPTIEKRFKNSRKRGWGLKIIESMMDFVKIDSHKGGTKLVMVKKGKYAEKES
jgi:serine/threonine-protein kinase RsbW